MATESELLELARINGRVCPQPSHWNRLYQLLPNRRQVGSSWEPPLPLILAAWWDAPDTSKAARLQEHISWAVAHGAGDKVHAYLSGLAEIEWHHAGD